MREGPLTPGEVLIGIFIVGFAVASLVLPIRDVFLWATPLFLAGLVGLTIHMLVTGEDDL